MMRRASFAFVVIIGLCLVVQTAYAWDFSLLAATSGTYQRTYTLVNNSSTFDVIEWTLHWNPSDWMDDINQGMANFDSGTGIIPPLPTGWYQVPAVFPWFAATNSQQSVKRNGGTKTGYIVRYGTTTNPSPVLPQVFTVSYMHGATKTVSQMMTVTDQAVPEPGTILVVVSGILSLAGGFRKRSV